MAKSITNVIIGFLLAILTGCSSPFRADLDEIEHHIIANSPDKAAAMLDTLNPTHADGESDLACYAILRARTADATGRALPLDSFTEISVRYYDRFPDSVNRILANYYAGRARMEHGMYAQAIVDFSNAHHSIEQSDGLIDILYPEIPTRIRSLTEECYTALDSLAELTDSITAEFFTANSLQLLNDNLDTLIRKPEQNRMSFTIVAILIWALFMTLLLSGLYIFNRIRQFNCERLADLAAVNHYISLFESAQHQLERHHYANAEMQREMAALVSARYDVFNAICDSLFTIPVSRHRADVAFARLTDTIKSLGTSEQNLAEIERETDRRFDNIISRLRTECSGLNDEEIRLFLYIVIGFTPRTLSVILDLPLERIYNRKSYLKRKIKSASMPSQNDFLRYL